MLKYKNISKSMVQQFLDCCEELTIKDPSTGCWNWTGMKDRHGYGYLNEYISHNKSLHHFVHRISFSISNPLEDITSKIVRHSCDNPSCWNPQHLSIGSQKDNIQDAIDRGRNCKGSASNFSKINEETVRAIRKEFAEGGTNYNRLSKKFMLSREHVRQIILRKRWGHLNPTEENTL